MLEGDQQLLGQYDGTNFIWTDQERVVNSLREHRLMAVKKDDANQPPSFIHPQSSMGKLENDEWTQMELANKQLPSQLARAVFTGSVQTAVRARIQAASAEGNTSLKEYYGLEEMGILTVFCGTWFRNEGELNEHCETIHRISTKRFFEGVKVIRTNTAVPAPPADVRAPVMEYFGAMARMHAGSITQFADGKG